MARRPAGPPAPRVAGSEAAFDSLEFSEMDSAELDRWVGAETASHRSGSQASTAVGRRRSRGGESLQSASSRGAVPGELLGGSRRRLSSMSASSAGRSGRGARGMPGETPLDPAAAAPVRIPATPGAAPDSAGHPRDVETAQPALQVLQRADNGAPSAPDGRHKGGAAEPTQQPPPALRSEVVEPGPSESAPGAGGVVDVEPSLTGSISGLSSLMAGMSVLSQPGHSSLTADAPGDSSFDALAFSDMASAELDQWLGGRADGSAGGGGGPAAGAAGGGEGETAPVKSPLQEMAGEPPRGDCRPPTRRGADAVLRPRRMRICPASFQMRSNADKTIAQL